MIYIQSFIFPEPCTGKEKHKIEHQAGLNLLGEALRREYGPEIVKACLAGEDGIRKGKNGKPYLEKYPEIHFNISHSGNTAVCAIGRSPLGVDVEGVRGIKDSVIRRVLTEKEQKYLGRFSDKDRAREFFRFWTLKESYAKALGRGLSMDFTGIEFELGAFTEAEDEEVAENFRILPAACTSTSADNEPRGIAAAGDWQFLQAIWKDGEEEKIISFCARKLPEKPYFCLLPVEPWILPQ